MKVVEVAFPIPVFNTFHYLADDELPLLSRVKAPFGRGSRTGYVLSEPEISVSSQTKLKKVSSVIDAEPVLTASLLKLAREMSSNYVSPLGEILGTVLPPFIKHPTRRINSKKKDEKHKETGFLLTGSQKKAVNPVIKSIEKKEKGSFLLEGVTASGKTEIYMHIVSSLIEKGSQVILLVPEIAVTAQITELFFNRFGEEAVSLWHSRISPVKKMRIINRLKSGRSCVLIGTRSAVFAPVKKLGAIILDEEQESSYKQEQSPFYDARWVSEKRCSIEGAQLIRSSATPSVETSYRARRGELIHLKMSERIYNAHLPEIALVDMKNEKGWMFSRYLINKMEEKLAQKRQVILFVNRRGFSRSVVCSSCGQQLKCGRCSITLSMHRSPDGPENILKCHICSRIFNIPVKCPECEGKILQNRGFGTQRVESAVKKFFPEAGIKRMDSDTTRSKESAKKIYRSFKQGKTDILVGTVLLSMGWDFPNVALVGVLDGDSLLYLPDFRASEKNYSLLRQVSGRCGRRTEKGEVIIQSFNPSHYSIRMQLDKRYESFYREEIQIRKTAGFPPYMKLVNIVCAHKNGSRASDSAGYVKDYVSKNIRGVEILGPAPAPRHKVRGDFRWQVILKYSPELDITEKLRLMKTSRPVKAVKMKIDTDPYNML